MGKLSNVKATAQRSIMLKDSVLCNAIDEHCSKLLYPFYF